MKLPSASRGNKLAICIPCRDQVHSLFTYNLTQLLFYCNSIKLPVNIFMQTGSLISRQRQNLAMAAIDDGATHILWLDSDMMYPTTLPETLLSHNKEIVACNYSTRTVPIKGVAYKKIGDWDSWLKPKNTTPRLQEVAGVGMGCMLTATSVFEKLDKPWFEVSWIEEYNDFIGEDFYFCILARQAGIPVYIDTVVSRDITHIGIAEFSLIQSTGWA